ncbi:MAG: hypothetical protein KC448_09560 [Yoonia sp.]|nr:hypothetical protein [Yoonia sp.]
MFKLLTAALLLAPVMVSAQTLTVPDGCEGVLTVQQRGCVMVNVWQCEADPAGDKWIALIGEGGVFSIQHVDREFQWIEAFKPSGTETLEQPAPDPSSITELLENGIDTWEFVLNKPDSAERNVGYDALTGLEVIIDDEPLLQTEFEGKTLSGDGTEIDNGAGRQYVSAKHRLFFFGESWNPATPDDVVDLSPVEFIYPGESGFFSERPKFECGVIESRFDG